MMMHLRAPAIICAVRPHGEHGAIVRVLTHEHGLLSGYVQGARGREKRAILIPGNRVMADMRARTEAQLAALSCELTHSIGQLLTEPLATAGIDWVTTLTAVTLPEAHPYPNLYEVLDGVLSAIEHAPAARGWAGVVARFEELLLAELGYGEELEATKHPNRTRERLVRHLLGDHFRDVLGTRERLIDRLTKALG